jgi:hypothetical protein
MTTFDLPNQKLLSFLQVFIKIFQYVDVNINPECLVDFPKKLIIINKNVYNPKFI